MVPIMEDFNSQMTMEDDRLKLEEIKKDLLAYELNGNMDHEDKSFIDHLATTNNLLQIDYDQEQPITSPSQWEDTSCHFTFSGTDSPATASIIAHMPTPQQQQPHHGYQQQPLANVPSPATATVATPPPQAQYHANAEYMVPYSPMGLPEQAAAETIKQEPLINHPLKQEPEDFDFEMDIANFKEEMGQAYLGQTLTTAEKQPKRTRASLLSPTDKKERRKEQNRRAAFKCRLKKKARQDVIAQEKDQLLEENQALTSEIEALKKEVAKFKSIMDEHSKTHICQLRRH